MKNLFLIDGATSVWKADLTSYVSNYLINSVILKKFSTRQLRENEKPEKLDLKFVAETEFFSINPDYQYVYNGHKYGFLKRDLDKALANYDNVFLIIRNPEIINRLRKEYTSCNITTVFIYTDTSDVQKKLPAQSRQSIQESARAAFLDYLRNPEMFDEVILNGSSSNDFYRLVNILISRQTNKVFSQDDKPIETVTSQIYKPFQLKMSPKFRALAGLTLGGLTTISTGFLVNMITNGDWSYWKYMSTVFSSLLSLLLGFLGILVILGSDKE